MTERGLPDRNGDRGAGVDDVDAAREPVRRIHRDGAHAVVAEVLLYLRDQVSAIGEVDSHRVVDLRQLLGEDRVDDDALDLHDRSDISSPLVGHLSPL